MPANKPQAYHRKLRPLWMYVWIPIELTAEGVFRSIDVMNGIEMWIEISSYTN